MGIRIEQLLSRLNNVKPTCKGWISSCPSHPDRNPSFVIKSGDRCLLLKCWAGCSLSDICAALGISVSDLFYDRNCNTQQIRRRQAEREYKKAKVEVDEMVKGFHLDAVREGDRFLKATIGTNISQFNGGQFDTHMKCACDALELMMDEERRGQHVHR